MCVCVLINEHLKTFYVFESCFRMLAVILVSDFALNCVVSLQAKEFGRKAVVASENNQDDNFSRNIVEFMKVCERVK